MLWLLVSLFVLYGLVCSFNVLSLQLLINITRVSEPGSMFWLKTLPMRERLYTAMKKRDLYLIQLVVSFTIALFIVYQISGR